MLRTHHCAELSSNNCDQTVALIGWVQAIRDHGGVFFIDLRDREGLTQIVFDPQETHLQEHIHGLKPESVIQITGIVRPRPDNTVNKNLQTGAIEVAVKELIIHNIADTLPFPLEDEKADKVNEDLRLTYRYLDLRRKKSYDRLKMRHEITRTVRNYFDAHKFIEIETPSLFKSTPEGAREFLVASRLNPGHFYALNQSPQQYKQILMVAGIERYYSLARCFRDEDLRADRQPEFTQVDLEMSFIDREDIYKLVEELLAKIWKDIKGVDIQTPFLRLTYQDAMDRFGSDKPDMRFNLEIKDFSEVFKGSGFKVFSSALEQGGSIKAFNAKGLADITQGELKSLEDIAKVLGAKGLAFIKIQNGEWKSPILKFLSTSEKEALAKDLDIQDGDLIFFAATGWEQACNILGRIRLEAAQLLSRRGSLNISNDDFKFLWVTDFPLMSYNDEANQLVSTHHPFTSPVPEDIPLLGTAPEKVRGQHYDIVVNGVELGGGSIRIHQSDVQKKVFEEVLKIPQDIVEARFGYMLKAFKFGTPPHGGIAFGLDRIAAILAGTSSIRDVIAFPKTQKGQDLMAQCPSPVTAKQLQEIYITTTDLPSEE